MNVLLTIDTEIWCDGWSDLDDKFASAFRRYVYGPTRFGDYGLPYQLKMLNDHGLRCVFFVESLFALRFGRAPLEEIVGLITDAGQSVELHAHTEWLDEARVPVFAEGFEKRPHIHDFSCTEQQLILKTAQRLLADVTGQNPRAYRAGSFAANNDTLQALLGVGISIDSSFNPAASSCRIAASKPMAQPFMHEGVLEVPVSAFVDGFGRVRPAQITACSWSELRCVLEEAYNAGWGTFVIVSHNFELLNRAKTRKNPITVRRLRRLCEYLDKNRDRLPTVDFKGSALAPFNGPANGIGCPTRHSVVRLGEQVVSNLS